MGAPQQAGGGHLHSHRIGRSLAALLLGWVALIGAAHAQTWTKIADENQSFSVSGTQTVRYGAGSSWIQTSVTGSGDCTNGFFGGDPILGTAKQCEVAAAQTPTWTKVADEGGSFSVSGTQTVRYGAGSNWIQTSITGSGDCTNGFFGSDPIPGVVKQCDVLGGAPPVTPPAYAGHHDGANCSTINGWAWDANQPNAAISVDLYDGATLLTTLVAGAYRSDLQAAGLGNGSHAFSLTPPASLKDGQTHAITIKYAGTQTSLPNSPQNITCAAGAALPAPPVSPPPVVSYEYDAQGNPTRTVQAPGVSGFGLATASSYDALNRQKDRTDARAGVTRFGYNGREDVTQVTDPRNLVTQSPRNGLGDTTALVSPDTGTATHTYDAAGNLKTRTDSRGVLATKSYDALNRQTGVAYTQSGQTTLSYGWAYDQTGAGYAHGIGRLTSTSHPSGSTQYSYDPQGRLLTDTQRVNPAAGANPAQISKTVTYGYDAAGHVTSILYPSGRMLSVTYTAGQPSALSLAKDSGSTAEPLIAGVEWEPFGGVKRWDWQLASGTQAHERVYDGSGRLVRYRLGNAIRDITYDAGDRITAYTHYDATSAAANPALDQSFGYDELGRLTGITTATSSWTIGYDANGNRTGVTLNGTASSYTTAATSNRLTGISNPARSFGHDSAGNTTSDSANYTGTYNLAGRLASLTKAGTTSSFSHDGMGRRVRKATSAGAASTVVFVYDQQGQLLGEYDSAGNTIREYVWLGATPIAMFTPDPANPANPPLVYFIHADHLDTPRVVVDRNNATRWRWLAEPFGTTAPETNPQGLGSFTFNLRFPGQYADQETGLNYNWNRDYDASIGRYAQSDPIGLEGGINTYAYVGGNPISYTDPSGLDPMCGPGQTAVSDPRNPGGQVFVCRPHPTESPNKPICITGDCAAGVLPTPGSPGCRTTCNVKYQLICTATGIGTTAATKNPMGGLAAGTACMVGKALVCEKVCDDQCKNP